MYDLEHRKKVSVMFAIMTAILFSAINQTIVGMALTHIIADLGGLEYFSWVFTAYILAASVLAVIVGGLSDIYGRKPFILWGIGIFIVGSILSGLATNIIELIAYRTIQGSGGGIIIATAFSAVGDLFPPRERGRWQGLLGATFGLASVIGPTIGGYIVDNWHWKWVFWVFIPIGLMAFALILRLFPSTIKKQKQNIDYIGAVLLTTTMVPLLLAFSWAGQRYDWDSPKIIGLIAATTFSFTFFIIAEHRARHPILPLSLFSNSIFTISNLIVFIIGASMYVCLLFMPLFLQGVMGLSAMESGSMMMLMTLSLVIASIFCGQIISHTGKYKNIAFFGLTMTTIGIYLLSTLNAGIEHSFILAYIMIVGLGLGIGLPVFNLTIQNAVDHDHLGIATATGQLFRQLGGTIGIALMGTAMSHGMQSQLEENLQQTVNPQMFTILHREIISRMESTKLLLNPSKFAESSHGLAPDAQQHIIMAMRKSLNTGLSHVFISAALAMFMAVLLVIFLKEQPLRTTMKKPEKNKA